MNDMTTPICDFIEAYRKRNTIRCHMPGHKGIGDHPLAEHDITEIPGADVLYQASGVIAESEKNLSVLFDSYRSYYSTQGSTLCLQAMAYMIRRYAADLKKKPIVAMARNTHISFLTAAGFNDLQTIHIPTERSSLISLEIDKDALEDLLKDPVNAPIAVYITSPDYLGNVVELNEIGALCHKHNALLVVDNAHGAYLKFLPQSVHPLDFSADIVCDSAHKTLPVLTGGSYLHIGKGCPKCIRDIGEEALRLFASTSPSYVILESLDRCNLYLSCHYAEKLSAFCEKTEALKKTLRRFGYQLKGNEPIKITLMPKSIGYTGYELSDILDQNNIVAEFCDPDYVVLMLSPEQGVETLYLLENVLTKVPIKAPVLSFPPILPKPIRAISFKEALFSPSETVGIEKSIGRILAQPSVSCPPAIPIIQCGEMIQEDHIKLFRYYSITHVRVVQ